MIWYFMHPRMTLEHLGYLPEIILDSDPRPVAEQIDDRYSHGGGWSPFKGFELLPNGNLKYPGDPEVRLLAQARLRNEMLKFYEHAWLLVAQSDNTWEVSRID